MLLKSSDLKLTGKYMEKSYKGLSIEATKAGFEASFAETDFYNKQTQDD